VNGKLNINRLLLSEVIDKGDRCLSDDDVMGLFSLLRDCGLGLGEAQLIAKHGIDAVWGAFVNGVLIDPVIA
jgi:hypothetical protein